MTSTDDIARWDAVAAEYATHQDHRLREVVQHDPDHAGNGLPPDGVLMRVWFWLLKNTLNRGVIRLARSGHGPFSLIRHVGRKTGRSYETPLLLALHGNDFIAELTYGPRVAWYRNVVAAGGCTVLSRGVEYQIDAVLPCDSSVGLRAFGQPAASVLRLLRRREFRVLSVRPPTRP